MKISCEYIILRTVGLASLFLVLAGSTLMAQGNEQLLKNTVNIAKEHGIPEQDLNDLIQRAHKKDIPDNEITKMLLPVIKLATQKLPYEPVIQKSLEGMTKGIRPAMITKVEERLQSDIMDAAPITDRWLKRPSIQSMIARSGESSQVETYRNKMLITVARVLFQGISREELGQLLSDMARNDVAAKMDARQVPAAIRILPDLSAGKNHPDIGRSLIIHAIKGHFTPDQIQQLPMAMARARQMNRLPAEALAHGIGRQIDKGVPATTILQDLFEGRVPGNPPNGVPPKPNNPHSKGRHGNDLGNSHGNENHGGHGRGGNR